MTHIQRGGYGSVYQAWSVLLIGLLLVGLLILLMVLFPPAPCPVDGTCALP